MRILVLLTCFIWLCIPSLAWNEKAADLSLQYLNDSVYSKIPTFKQSLYNDYSEIQRIINLYKQNPDLIKTKDINSFGLACKTRNQTLLSVYENKFFKPAYNKYFQLDKSLTYEDWKHSVALSEGSLFYDFYTFTEANLRDCEKISVRSTSR